MPQLPGRTSFPSLATTLVTFCQLQKPLVELQDLLFQCLDLCKRGSLTLSHSLSLSLALARSLSLSLCVCVRACVCVCVRVSVCLPVCLFVCLFVCLSVCLSVVHPPTVDINLCSRIVMQQCSDAQNAPMSSSVFRISFSSTSSTSRSFSFSACSSDLTGREHMSDVDTQQIIHVTAERSCTRVAAQTRGHARDRHATTCLLAHAC